VVVRHHEFGFKANAMVVWNVPEADLAAIGELLAGYEGVNLCYSRPRRLPDWTYNLFCMLAEQTQGSAQDAQVNALGLRVADLEQQADADKRRPAPISQADFATARARRLRGVWR